MSEPVDWLVHSARLMSDPAPSDIDLRRAVSAAYYGLFHLLTASAAVQMAPVGTASFVSLLRRGIDHKHLRLVSEAVAARGRLNPILGATGKPPSDQLAGVAAAVQTLQTARHQADYDLNISLTVPQGSFCISTAKDAFANWALIAQEQEAQVFLTLMMLPDRRRRG